MSKEDQGSVKPVQRTLEISNQRKCSLYRPVLSVLAAAAAGAPPGGLHFSAGKTLLLESRRSSRNERGPISERGQRVSETKSIVSARRWGILPWSSVTATRTVRTSERLSSAMN